jgi:hypothetical protein
MGGKSILTSSQLAAIEAVAPPSFWDALAAVQVVRETRRQGKWRPFEQARAFVRSLGFESSSAWGKWASSDKRPVDIPSNPNLAYEEWAGYGDWLGTGNIQTGNMQFRPFEEARAYVQSLGLAGHAAWVSWCASGSRPRDIPAVPNRVYEEWKDWGDWLGTHRRRGGYLPFEQARRFVHTLGLRNYEEWCVWRKSGKRPVEIPTNPQQTYQEWLGYGDWLGNGRVQQYRPFEEARAFVQSLGLKSHEWAAWCKSGKRPHDIPANPRTTYKAEWVSWVDWLGTGNVYTKEFLPFEEARAYVRVLGLKSQAQWNIWRRTDRPPEIPSDPPSVYRAEWKSWGDWLGTGYVNHADRKFRPFGEARTFVRSLRLPGQLAWQAWCAAGKRPHDIPARPNRTYRQEWKGWADWLGYEPRISPRCTAIRPFREARSFVRSLGLKNSQVWADWCKSGERPQDIPTRPDRMYPEWVNWGDWIGAGRKHGRTQ